MKDVILLDSRNSITEGFIPGSVNIPLKIPFANWVGTMLSYEKDMVIVAEPGSED